MVMNGKTKTFSVCMDVDWFLARTPYPDGYVGMLKTRDGVPLTAAEALSFMTMEKAKGHKVIPMSADCGRHCKHESQGCVGFDYSGGGCPGYYNSQKGGESGFES